MDEIHSAVGADPSKTVAEVIEYCKQDQPPIFFLLLHGWYKFFGYTDFVGRLLGLLTGLLGILSMYFLGREFKNVTVGVMAALLTAINYIHVDFSRQVRFYPLVFFFASLSYLFFLRVLKLKKPIDFIYYSLATAALLSTHYFGLVVLASQFILFAFIIWRKKISDLKFIGYSMLSGVVVGLSFLYWLPVVTSDLKIPSFHLQQVTWYFPIQFYWVYFRDVVTCLICATLSFFSFREMVNRFKENSNGLEDIVVIGWIGLGFLIPLVYSIVRMPMLEYRYTFILLPAIILMVALGFEAAIFSRLKYMKESTLKFGIVVVLILAFCVNALFGKTIYVIKQPHQQWREVTQEVMKTESENQIVLAEYAWYFRYYFKIANAKNAPVEPRYADVGTIVANYKSIWVVTSKLFPDKGLSLYQQKMIEANFEIVKELTFYDFNVIQYTKR